MKVLRSKVHQKHSGKEESSTKKDSTSHKSGKKSSHLHTILKSKTTTKKLSLSDKSSHVESGKTTKHAKADSRSMVFKENELKPQIQKAYKVDEADILEGDDDEDEMLPYSRGRQFKVAAIH